MTNPRESFETYPYNPDAPGPFAPQDPVPTELQPRLVQSPAPASSPPPSGMGRRGVLAAGGVLAAVIAGGFVLSNSGSSLEEDYYPVGTAPEEVPEDFEPETKSAFLALPDGREIYLEVPADWQVVSDVDYLVLFHEHGRVVARVPEWNRATRSDLAKEADYLRDGFDPDGEPTVFDESTNRVTQLHQIIGGHLNGLAGTEETMLILDSLNQQALALWWATVEGTEPIPRQARTMVADLRAGFLEP